MGAVENYLRGLMGKIVTPFVVIIVLTMTAIVWVSLPTADRGLETQSTKKAEVLAKSLAAVCDDSLSRGTVDKLNNILQEIQDIDKDIVYAYLVDDGGHILVRGRERSGLNQRDMKAFEEGASSAMGFSILRSPRGGSFFEAVCPVVVKGEKQAVLRIGLTEGKAHTIMRGVRKTVVVIGFLALLVGCVVYVLLADKALRRPIGKVLVVVKDLAQDDADLTRRLDINTKDEMGELARWFNRFMDRLHDIIVLVKDNTEYVAKAASGIDMTSSQLAKGAEQQTTQASEVATSVQEMTAAIIENSQNATQTSKLAEQASEKAKEGSGAMQDTLESMEEIVLSTAKTGEIVDSLSGRADQIGEVIRVIDEIADQTNLLALNAAIEAARAGEQGRGFAVVADEVRKLAERTTKATGEIAETIKAIQGETREASESTEAARCVVNKGKSMLVKTEGVLGEIVGSVAQAMEMIRQIAVASEEMSGGAEEISQNVEAISTVTRQSASGAEQMSLSANALNKQMEKLQRLVDLFMLDEQAAEVDMDLVYGGNSSQVVASRRDRVREAVAKTKVGVAT